MKKLVIAFLVLSAYQCFANDEPATQPATAPTTQESAAAAPSTQPVITPEAQAELDLMRDAFINLKSLDITGVLSANFDVAGKVDNEKADLTASFAAPDRFRHEMKGDVLVGSTGEKVYAYKADEKLYMMADAPKPARSKSFPDDIAQLLSSQNPMLLAAMSGDASAQLTHGYETVSRLEDEQIDGKPFVHLRLDSPNGPTDLWIDPQTHLLRRLTRDVSPQLIKRGEDAVKSASLTLDYTRVVANEIPSDASFDWAPPADARDLTKIRPLEAGSQARAMIGKPAPDFKLEDLEGKSIALADLKDSVVVLDFWATWCIPCRVTLPEHQKHMEEFGPRGVKFFAVNQQEEKERVAEFVKKTNLTVPVLLDIEGTASTSYHAEALPTLFVIGRDGVIAKVFLGIGHDEEVRAAIETALK